MNIGFNVIEDESEVNDLSEWDVKSNKSDWESRSIRERMQVLIKQRKRGKTMENKAESKDKTKKIVSEDTDMSKNDAYNKQETHRWGKCNSSNTVPCKIFDPLKNWPFEVYFVEYLKLLDNFKFSLY